MSTTESGAAPAPTALIISGGGRYSDPWHPFAETSAALASFLRDEGIDATIATLGEDDVPTQNVDLLVINAGGGSTPRELAEDAADPNSSDAKGERLAQWVISAVKHGIPTLAVHTSSNTFYEAEEWEDLVGGRWIPQVSWHPKLGPFTLIKTSTNPPHEITKALDSLEVVDEQYCDLRVSPTSTVLIAHEHQGKRQPIVWLSGHEGVKLIHDALGHNGKAYDGAARRQLLRAELAWLRS